MSPLLLEAVGVIPQIESTPAKRSKIPQRPTSSHANSQGESISTNASLSQPSAPHVPECNMVSTSKISRIPKAPYTPTRAPASRGRRSNSGRGGIGVVRSNQPRALIRGKQETPAVKSPPAQINKKPSPPANCDKALPSPPIAQVIDPNSPPKASRTLVDADTGSPSDEQWPVLKPENVTHAKSEPTSNLTVVQQQQQPQPQSQSQPNLSESSQLNESSESFPYFSTNTLVKIRKTSPSAASAFQSKLPAIPTINENIPIQDARIPQSNAPRWFSSNNPYARALHTVSPTADLASDSPLALKKSRLMVIPIPPRISSNRISQPLIGRTQYKPPTRSASAQPAESRPISAEWPLSSSWSREMNNVESREPSFEQVMVVSDTDLVTEMLEEHTASVSIEPMTHQSEQYTDALACQSLSSSPDQHTPTTTLEVLRAQPCEGPGPEQEISIFQALVQPAQIQDNFLHSDSFSRLPSGSVVEPQPWVYNPESKYWAKKLSWQEEKPVKSPILSIHRDAETILLGNNDVPPEEPEESEQGTGRLSLNRSFGALATRKSRQTLSRTAPKTEARMQTPGRILTGEETTPPEVSSPIRPIRSMKPARQSSAELPLSSPVSISQRGSQSKTARKQPVTIPITETVPETSMGPLSASSAVSPNFNGANFDETMVITAVRDEMTIDQLDANKNTEEAADSPLAPKTSGKNAGKVLDLHKDTPPKDTRSSMKPRWMKDTLSSIRAQRKAVISLPRGCVNSREVSVSSLSTSAGDSTLNLRRLVGRTGPSKLRASTNATLGSDRSCTANSVSRGTQTLPGWVEPITSPTPLDGDTTAQPPIRFEEEVNSASFRLKAKKSFRNLFPKSDTKLSSASKLPQPVRKSTDPNCALIATSSETLVKRLSRNFSKVHLPIKKPDIPEFELQNLEALAKRNAAVAVPETASPVIPASLTTLQRENGYMVSHLLSGLSGIRGSTTPPSPNCVRRLNMAESSVHAAELLKQSYICREKACQHARTAKLLVQRVKVELAHFDVLADHDFEDEEVNKTVEKLKNFRIRIEEAANIAGGIIGETEK